MKRYWAEYSRTAFAALPREELIAVLPIGATEQHGPHLPISVDAAIVREIVARTITLLPSDNPTLFLPVQDIGKSIEHDQFPGTLSFSADILAAMWREIGACVANSGVRKLVFLNSHGGQVTTMESVARDLRIRHDMLVFSINWFELGLPDGLYSASEQRFGIHAGDVETSMMLALDPAKVDMAAAEDFIPSLKQLDDQFTSIGLDRAAKPAWQAQDLHPAGACGNAAVATAQKGEQTFDHAARRLAAVLTEIAEMSADWVVSAPSSP